MYSRKFKAVVVVFAALALTVVVGCAKKPSGEIDAAKSAVDSVFTVDAERYAPETAASIRSEFEAAMEEVDKQDKKVLKNFDSAKQMLASVKANAEKAVETVAAKKEEARQVAIAAKQSAEEAVAEASGLLAKAPSGKGTTEDIEALKADVRGLEESLPEVQSLLDSGDYFGASEKAGAIKTKADEIKAEVSSAIEKVTAGRKRK